jgi:hypothetical protein
MVSLLKNEQNAGRTPLPKMPDYQTFLKTNNPAK